LSKEHGIDDEQLAKTIIRGKKKVEENNYAILVIYPQPISALEEGEDVKIEADVKKKVRYFKRVGIRWIEDTDMADSELSNELLCNTDKNCSYKKINHQEKIKDLNKHVTLGIHPSYRSNGNSSQVMIENERLEKSVSRKVKHSRQHFLKLKFPQTYHDLVHAGITNDYTMGYADHVGFRSGTARSFQWFDLSANQITTLTIHPFVYMDGTLNEYLNLDLAASKHKIANLYNDVRTYGGCFRFIWHNETIGDYGRWKGWSEILEYSLNLK
jgi:hypothetical protein